MISDPKDRKARIKKYGVAFEVASAYDIVHSWTTIRIMVCLPDEQLYVAFRKFDEEPNKRLTKREVALGLRAIARKIIHDEKKRGLK